MGEYIDKAKGAANEAIGQAKVSIGKHTDKPELVVEGIAQQAKGKIQSVKAAIKHEL